MTLPRLNDHPTAESRLGLLGTSSGKPSVSFAKSEGTVTPGVAKAQTAPRVVGKMNQTEARYAKERLEPRRLAGEVVRYDYEPVKLRLADDTFLTVDFRVILSDGTEEYHEVKGGFVREDSWVKLKIAAELHPYVFRMAQLRKGFWTVTQI